MDQGMWVVIALAAVSLGLYFAESLNVKEMEITVVSVDSPVSVMGGHDHEAGYQLVDIAEARRVKANFLVARELKPGKRYRVRLVGWDISWLGMYRRVAKILEHL